MITDIVILSFKEKNVKKEKSALTVITVVIS